jgi:Domain of unknown function (DUF4367)
MNEERIKLILDQLGKQAFPDDIDPWSPIKDRLAQNRTIDNFTLGNPFHPQHQLRRQFLQVGVVLIIFVAVVFFLLSPSGKALAETIRHLFRPISVEQLPPLSSEDLASPTFVPTFAVTLAPILESTPLSTPLPVPTIYFASGLSACNTDPYGYTCRIAKAEKKAGFDIKEFPADPQGFYFKEVAQAELGQIMLEYDVIGGGGYLYLNQGLGSDFPAFTGAVPEEAIETVQVGNNSGEYVAGDYVYGGVYKEPTWLPCCRFRLRWTDGQRWYELDKEAAMPQTDYLTREVMIQMATQLVDQPVQIQEPNLDHLTNLEEASQVVEFAILAPTLLPDGFVFDYASYDRDLSQLQMTYSPPGTAGTANILIIETPLDKVSMAPSENGEELKGETVDINGNPGVYFSNDPYTHALTWESGNVKITLWVYSSDIGYGGSFTKDQILEIGRSLK